MTGAAEEGGVLFVEEGWDYGGLPTWPGVATVLRRSAVLSVACLGAAKS